MDGSSPSGGRRCPVVLHVVEAYGGGVATAVNEYIEGLPELRHVVLAFRRTGSQIAADVDAEFWPLPAGRLAQLRAVHRTIRSLRPDVIHAHSSYAGGYVRTAPHARRSRVVYSPHCYAFERRDVSGAIRAIFWAVEAALSFRTDAVAAVSDWEELLTRRLPGLPAIGVVPHTVKHALPPARRATDGAIVTVGRIQPQKDPAFFAAAARDARLLGGAREWRWIGGGDPELEARLRECGVTVTGWQRRDEVLAELARAHTYVHTAAWEAGPPIALLEAGAMGLPVVARDIPPIRRAGVETLAANPIELAQHVLRLEAPAARASATRQAGAVTARLAAADQAAALRSLYGVGVAA